MSKHGIYFFNETVNNAEMVMRIERYSERVKKNSYRLKAKKWQHSCRTMITRFHILVSERETLPQIATTQSNSQIQLC